ncbi:ATP-binding protein [Streptomyces sp. NPDC004528]|uniref:ATP-binding protein n=1 Tax=Streptomyces sp. NPDC004528 TaxID=3154550 RepID=UPI0033A0BC27
MLAARASGTDVPSYTETWPCVPESARQARRLVSLALSLWGVSDAAAAGELIALELVSNAIRHVGRPTFRITIARPDTWTIKISVADSSRTEPALRTASAECESGRGLHLVAALSTDWGCDRKSWGKVVWAEMKVSAP